MKRLLSFFLGLIGLTAISASAQIVTTSPAILQEESQNVVLTYHADSPLGNNGLKGVTSDVYAHIGVITDQSSSLSDWKYATPTWGDNSEKYKLTFVSANTWNLNIGNIRTYFGITDPNEHVEKIALVFRTGDTSKEGKTAAGGDIYVDVQESGFRMALVSNATSLVLTSPTSISFTVNTTRTAQISLSVNGTSIGSASGMQLVKSYNFSTNGTYEVKATATADGQTLTETLTVAYPKAASVQGNFPGGNPSKNMGARANSDGSVTFCFAAPGKSSVVLVPSWDDYAVLDKNTMKYHDYNGQRYFWITVNGLPQDQYLPYYYLVDRQYKVGDPYAELIMDPYNDKWLPRHMIQELPAYPLDKFSDVMLAVYCGNKHKFNFSSFQIPDHFNLTIYEMLFRDFTADSNGPDGHGTIRTAMAKIPYLKSLGVNVVELMPVMEFNGNNSWGYNTNFYMAVDKAYGMPLELKEFVEECHRNGMAVVLDIVFNQADGLHPWYQMYPKNSNPFFNGTNVHDHSVLNDWKQESALVRQQWEDAIRYWMTEFNVDGFRFDLVKGLGDSNSYGGGTENYNSSRVVNMKRLQDVITSVKPNGIHINEHLAGAQEENAMAATGQINWANLNYLGQNYARGKPDNFEDFKRFLSTSDSRTKGSTVAYLESHDEQRIAYAQKNDGNTVPNLKNNYNLRMNRLAGAAVQMLMTPGPKMIWQFGELGDDQNTKDSEGHNDTSPKQPVWQHLDDPDRAAIHDTYAQLCNLRKDNPDLFGSNANFYAPALSSATGLRIFRLTSGSKEVVAIVNPGNGGATAKNTATVPTSLISASCYKVVNASKGNNFLTPTGEAGALKIDVPHHGYIILATPNTTDIQDIVGDNVDRPAVVGGVGEITVLGDYNTISVYDLTGRAFDTTNLPAGLYIVNVDGFATKVLVK